jgi:hypothetical protein
MARANQTMNALLLRHVSGDWGDLQAHDLAENICSLKHGSRVMSGHRTICGAALWLG